MTLLKPTNQVINVLYSLVLLDRDNVGQTNRKTATPIAIVPSVTHFIPRASAQPEAIKQNLFPTSKRVQDYKTASKKPN